MIRVFGSTDGIMDYDGNQGPTTADDPLRVAEQTSIEQFVAKHRGFLKGRVLDFGAGKPGTCRKPQPYRAFVAGHYIPYDKGDALPDGDFDAILCTQVLQYLRPREAFLFFRDRLRVRGGVLVMTYATNWPEVEPGDKYRYTKAGMDEALVSSGFSILEHEPRAALVIPPNEFILGYGVVARASA